MTNFLMDAKLNSFHRNTNNTNNTNTNNINTNNTNNTNNNINTNNTNNTNTNNINTNNTTQYPIIINKNFMINHLSNNIIYLDSNVIFEDDIEINKYVHFIITSNIIINGNNKTITINYNSLFNGLFHNMGSIITYNLKDLTIKCKTSTLSESFGWFCGQFSNATVTNCHSDGNISKYGGGIFGRHSTGTAINCSSNGLIGDYAGGIFGANTTGTAINCSSNGQINAEAGGIFGSYSKANAENCYSNGKMYSHAGGIFGSNTTNSSANNCYSIGDIIGQCGGGIFGINASKCNTYNCFSLSKSANILYGGIYGSSDNLCNINQCYILSSTFTGNSLNFDSQITTNSYIETDHKWNDIHAYITLNGVPIKPNSIGTVWTSIEQNKPFILSSSCTFEINQDFINKNSNNVSITLDKNTIFKENITINSTLFFIVKSGVLINGNNTTITINNVINYPGLFKNYDNSYTPFYLFNLHINASNSELRYESPYANGWFCHKAGYAIVNNLSSNGKIPPYAGGILGSDFHGTATNCFSTGIIDNHAGGIFGSQSNNCTATNCYSTGDISENSGGIFGYNSSGTATNCFSTGPIIGTTLDNNGGGIFAKISTATIKNCYRSGGNNFKNTDFYGNQSSGTIDNCFSETDGKWNDVHANKYLTGTPSTNHLIGEIWVGTGNNLPFKLKSHCTHISKNTTITTTQNNQLYYPIIIDNNVTLTFNINFEVEKSPYGFFILVANSDINTNNKAITNIFNYTDNIHYTGIIKYNNMLKKFLYNYLTSHKLILYYYVNNKQNKLDGNQISVSMTYFL